MSVNAETPIASSVANGVTTVFPYSFTVLAAADLKVQGLLSGVTTLYVLGVDYTVLGVGTNSGSATFIVAPANTTVITRYRDTQITRATDYQDNGDLLSATLDLDFDRLYLLMQEIFSGGKGVVNALRVPNGETVPALSLAASRANQLLGFDSSGNPITVAPVSGSAAALALDLASTSDTTKGDFMLGVKSSLTGGTDRTQHSKNADFVNIFDVLTPAQILDVTSNAASIDITAIIQALLDAASEVYFPNGTYKITAALNLNDYQVIRCQSRLTEFKGGFAGAIFQGKNPTTVRRFGGAIHSGKLTHVTRATAGSIGLDFKSLTMWKVFGTLIQEVEIGVKNGGASSLGAYYNEFYAVDVSGVGTGYDNGTLGNDNKVFGGRVNDSVTGTRDNDCTGNLYIGCAVETFTARGHLNADAVATTNIKYSFSRLENLSTSGIGIDIRPLAQVCSYIYPQFVGLATNVNDASAGKDTNGFSDLGLIVKSSTPIRGHYHVTVNRDIASLAAGAFRQEGPITVTGCKIGDALTYTVPAAWPNNIMAGATLITANDTAYILLYNPSGSAIDPAAGNFEFSWVRS